MNMASSENLSISHVAEVLAHSGHEVTHLESGVLRIRDLDSGISFQAVLEGNVLYMTVTLMTVPSGKVTPELMRKMLAADNGISTSAFQLYNAGDGKTAIT